MILIEGWKNQIRSEGTAVEEVVEAWSKDPSNWRHWSLLWPVGNLKQRSRWLIVISSNNNGFWGLCSDLIIPPVCDETQNLNDTDSKIPNFPRPVPGLFPIPNSFETNSNTFFLVVEIFEIGSRIFSVPKLFETGSGTFVGTKFLQYWFRYHKKK